MLQVKFNANSTYFKVFLAIIFNSAVFLSNLMRPLLFTPDNVAAAERIQRVERSAWPLFWCWFVLMVSSLSYFIAGNVLSHLLVL